MNKKEKDSEVEIDLLKLLKALWNKKWTIILVTLLCAFLAAAYTIFLISPTYRVEFQAYVYNYQDSSGLSSVTSSDYSASSNLATTYANILNNRTVVEAALAATTLEYTFEDIEECISTDVVDDTQILTVYVTMTDAQEAYELAVALENEGLETLSGIVEGSSVKIISQAQMPTTKYSPSNTKNTIIGALLGFVIAVVVIVIITLVDDTVKDERSLEEAFDVHVIGSIPNFASSAKSESYYSQSSGAGPSKKISR